MLETTHADARRSSQVLLMSTVAFTACFAVWTLFSILAIPIQAEYGLAAGQVGMLMALPILVGSVGRLPLGMLTDRYGGRSVFSALLAFAAIPTFLLSLADSYLQLLACGVGLGVAGASFAVGTAYVACWTPADRRGSALGIFGAGTLGAAITALVVPFLLTAFGDWRMVPRLYAAMLAVVAVAFAVTMPHRREHCNAGMTLADRLRPLTRIRVWRFGLYYFLFFGGFVGLGLWLPNYFKNVYFGLSLEQIALVTQAFLLPAAFVRAAGGWLSDRLGARVVMYKVLAVSVFVAGLLAVPPSELTLLTVPFQCQPAGVEQPVYYTVSTDKATGRVTTHVVGLGPEREAERISGMLAASPRLSGAIDAYLSQVRSGAITPQPSRRTIPFTLDIRLFLALLFVLGTAMGLGMGAVYTYIPRYFPQEVGAVGGLVGMIGGLGGFFLPIAWGYLLGWTGSYPLTLFTVISMLSLLCLGWLHYVVRRYLEPREARRAAGAP